MPSLSLKLPGGGPPAPLPLWQNQVLPGSDRLPGKFVLPFLPVPVLVGRILESYPGYRFVEDIFWPDEFASLLKKMKLDLAPRGAFLLRDQRPFRAGVVLETAVLSRSEKSRAYDMALRRLLNQALQDGARNQDDFSILPFSEKMAGRYGFPDARPVLLLVWTADRQPLELLFARRPAKSALLEWKESLLLPGASPVLPAARQDLNPEIVGQSAKDRFRQKVIVKSSAEKIRITMFTTPAALDSSSFSQAFLEFKGCRNVSQLRAYFKEHPRYAGLIVEVTASRRMRAILAGSSPVVWRQKRTELFYQNESGVHIARGRLLAGDAILLLPGTLYARSLKKLKKVFSKKQSRFIDNLNKLLQKEKAGKGLLIRF